MDPVVRELRAIVHHTGLARTIAIGQLVLDRFFGGSTELWQDRRRNKNNSIRRLADCPTCPLSRSALNQAVGVFAAVRSMPGASELPHVGASHIVAVLALPDGEREDWLRRADSQLWSVRRLNDEIRCARRCAGERRGRPRLAIASKLLGSVNGALQALEEGVQELLAVGVDGPELTNIARRLALLESRLSEHTAAPPRETIVVRKTRECPPVDQTASG
jgi:hypothetical protein